MLRTLCAFCAHTMFTRLFNSLPFQRDLNGFPFLTLTSMDSAVILFKRFHIGLINSQIDWIACRIYDHFTHVKRNTHTKRIQVQWLWLWIWCSFSIVKAKCYEYFKGFCVFCSFARLMWLILILIWIHGNYVAINSVEMTWIQVWIIFRQRNITKIVQNQVYAP